MKRKAPTMKLNIIVENPHPDHPHLVWWYTNGDFQGWAETEALATKRMTQYKERQK
jgi:hypothetical protein